MQAGTIVGHCFNWKGGRGRKEGGIDETRRGDTTFEKVGLGLEVRLF